MKRSQLAARPIEPLEVAGAKNAVAEIQPAEKWVQEEEAFKNRPVRYESAQEKVQRLVPGFDLKRLWL